MKLNASVRTDRLGLFFAAVAAIGALSWFAVAGLNVLTPKHSPSAIPSCYSPVYTGGCDPGDQIPMNVQGFNPTSELALFARPRDESVTKKCTADFTWVGSLLRVHGVSYCTILDIEFRQTSVSAHAQIRFQNGFAARHHVLPNQRMSAFRLQASELEVIPRNNAMFFRLNCTFRGDHNKAKLTTFWLDTILIDYDLRRIKVFRNGIALLSEAGAQFKDIQNDLMLPDKSTVFAISQEDFGSKGKLNNHPTVLVGYVTPDGKMHEISRFSDSSRGAEQPANTRSIRTNPQQIITGGVELEYAAISSPLDMYSGD